MLNLVLFGPPGAGKGTQSNLLIDKYNLIHLSTGDILREEIKAGTTLGLEAKAIMDRGDLVSDKIVIGMISSKLDNNPNANGFIFDGFPRTAAQAEALDALLEEKETSISAMLSLKDFYTAQKKLSEIEGLGSVEDISHKLNAVIDSL
jgi:adenylate kinase